MKKNLITFAQVALLGALTIFCVYFATNSVDTEWDNGFYKAIEEKKPVYKCNKLEYDEFGDLTVECVERLKKTVFKDHELLIGHGIPSENELEELESIFGHSIQIDENF